MADCHQNSSEKLHLAHYLQKVLPRLKCSPEGFVCHYIPSCVADISHSELSNLCAGSSQPPLWQVKFACIPARPTHSCRVYSGFHLLFNCVLASVFWLTFDCVICDICVCVLWQSFDCAYTT